MEEKYLPKLIETLKAQKKVELEVIIVDRESVDSSLQIIKSYSDIVLVSEPPENGLVAGYHAGFLKASHDLIFFCNEDMWFDEWCLFNCARQINLSERIASSDPWQWTYDGKELAHAGIRFKKKISAYYFSKVIPFIGTDTLVNLADGDFIPHSSAGACMIHKIAYKDSGGWDTTFFLDYEEEDLFIRFQHKKWKAVTVPSAKVFHAISVASSKTVKKVSVKKKRNISGMSNKTIIAIKYFPWRIILMNVFASMIIMIVAFLKLKFKRSWYILLSFFLTFRRLKYALLYRKNFTSKSDFKKNVDFYLKDFFLK